MRANGGRPAGTLACEYRTVRSDGFVLARNTGNDDSVRLAGAAAPSATPPVSPMIRTSPGSRPSGGAA